MIAKGRDEKFGPQKPRNRGREIGGLTVTASSSIVIIIMSSSLCQDGNCKIGDAAYQYLAVFET